jgi:hypothetical protein
MSVAPERVAQICNLPYRRFSTCRPLEFSSRYADYKSAIQQISNLRYELAPLSRGLFRN